MKNLRKNEVGITLIALVITIIVLLILAGITINLTIGQDGIITTAQQAGKNYTQAYDDEQEQLATFYSDTDGLISTLTGEGGGTNNTVVDRTGLNVGDYIDYTPDTATGTVYPASKLSTEITGYEVSNTVTIVSGNSSNSIVETDGNSTDLTMDDLDWQILRIYEDGSMDLIGSVTSKCIRFKNAIGYNNGVYVMNDICKTLYSRTSAEIIARSVNIEDIEYWLQKDADGKTVKDKYINSDTNLAVGGTKTYTESSSKYPTLWARQTGATITTSSGTTTVTTGGISESDNGYTSATTEETYLPTSPTSSDSITVKQTWWSGDINETNFGAGSKALYSSTNYWVASRYSLCGSSCAYFGLRYAGTGINGGNYVFYSNGWTGSSSYRLRPIVSLKSSVQIDKSSTATDSSTPHHIVSY